MQAAELGAFVLMARVVTAVAEHPALPVRQLVDSDLLRRDCDRRAHVPRGLTAVVIIYAPLGRRSGAHVNPAGTLTFFRLGKAKACDALFYVVAQLVGGIGGVARRLPRSCKESLITRTSGPRGGVRRQRGARK